MAAKEMNVRTIGLLGEGGALTPMVDCAIVIPSRNTQYIQEGMLCIEHIIYSIVERVLFDPNFQHALRSETEGPLNQDLEYENRGDGYSGPRILDQAIS